MTPKIKVIFVGTPKFSVPYLNALLSDDSFEVVGIITQPDKPIGRKKIITPSPVKQIALENNLLVFQPEKLKSDEEVVPKLKDLKADLIIVVAYGQIIPAEILAIPKLGNINVHPSLLPKFRGASPIQNAILNNETVTGVTIMLMDEKMDHGAVLAQNKLSLGDLETSESLHKLMSNKDQTDFLIETIKAFCANNLKPQIQDDSAATFCKLITKAEAQINWTDSATNISAKIRAFYTWPVAWTILNNQKIKIFPPVEILNINNKPGKIFVFENKLAIGCGSDSIALSDIQIEGKNKIKAIDYYLGHKKIIDLSFE